MKPADILRMVVRDDPRNEYWYGVREHDHQAHRVDLEWLGGDQPVKTLCGIDMTLMPCNAQWMSF